MGMFDFLGGNKQQSNAGNNPGTPGNTSPGNNNQGGNPAPAGGNRKPSNLPGTAVFDSMTGERLVPDNTNGNNQNPANPLDSFAKIFDNANKVDDDPNKAPKGPPKFELDPKILGEVASKLDFTQGINPELMQKATSGDVQSMVAVMQEVGRNAYRASLEHSSRLSDSYLNGRFQFEAGNMGNLVKQHMTNNSIASNPALKHPLIKQEVTRLASLMSKSPEYADSSPEQLQDMALQYITSLAEAANSTNKSQEPAPNAGLVDWDKLLLSQ